MKNGGTMHIQVVNFHLNDLSDAEFRGLCDEVAPAFAEVPGLISKVWLENRSTNTYGGVYTWENRQAMEDYSKSELFRGVAANPSFAGITSSDFGVLEGPTSVTRGLAAVRT
jgi:heme-degrading monooxygenase HmoA